METIINTLIDHHCKNKAKLKDRNMEGKLIVLNEMKVLSDARYKMLDEFRDLRNAAVHLEHGVKFEITEEIIQKFSITINPKATIDAKFAHICIKMVLLLWNDHVPVLKNKFPELHN